MHQGRTHGKDLWCLHISHTVLATGYLHDNQFAMYNWKEAVLLYIHKYSLLGAIKLAVVANKFNLPLNKAGIGSSFLYDQDKNFNLTTTTDVI